MTWLSPVTLSGPHARLEPLSLSHRDGLIDAVKDADATARKLIDEENRDRKALYALIAKDEGIDADVVARRAAKRNFDKAKKGEFLKDNGTWRQK